MTWYVSEQAFKGETDEAVAALRQISYIQALLSAVARVKGNSWCARFLRTDVLASRIVIGSVEADLIWDRTVCDGRGVDGCPADISVGRLTSVRIHKRTQAQTHTETCAHKHTHAQIRTDACTGTRELVSTFVCVFVCCSWASFYAHYVVVFFALCLPLIDRTIFPWCPMKLASLSIR